MPDEVELLTNVAPLPVLSSTLRCRVLAAAGAARARRRRARRVVLAAFVSFVVLALVSWIDALPAVSRNLSAIESGLAEMAVTGNRLAGNRLAGNSQFPSAPYCRRERLIAAMSDDWRMVEAEFKSREEFTRRVQM